MNSVEVASSRHVKILGFSDTYGDTAGNGVGRFLCDLHRNSIRDELPLQLIVPGRSDDEPGLTTVRAPSFTVPGYSKLSIATPLEHHRKRIERRFRRERSDCIHVSTPGPLGMFGVMLAKRYRTPLVGIYHTDFPSYAHQITRSWLEQISGDPLRYGGPLMARLAPTVFSWLASAKRFNPEIESDLKLLTEVAERNWTAFNRGDGMLDDLARVAEEFVRRLMRRFYSGFATIIARSRSQQQELTKELGIDPDRVECLCPGTDTERFHPRFADRSIWRQWGIPEQATIVLHVGRATAEKNVSLLLELWERVQRSATDEMRLVMVGHGEPRDLDRARACKNVHVIGSHSGETLSRIYSSADMLVFPSSTETLGQVGLEAAASGLPVLVSDIGGPRMYVDDGRTGYVCSSSDAQNWTDRVLELAQDRPRRLQMGRDARQHVAGRFTIGHSLDSYWQLHRQAVDRFQSTINDRPRTRRAAVVTPELQAEAPTRGVMFISDYHAGRRYGSRTERNQKREALRTMLSTALEQQLDVILGGDFGDHGARTHRLEADFAALRETRKELGFHGEPIFLRGNHDYGFSDQQLCEYTGGCDVHSGLVYFHPEAEVTFTHGHILALAKTLEVINDSVSADELVSRLQEDVLDEDLKPSVIAYDLANMVEATLANQGLTGLNTVWEGMYSSRAMLAERLLSLARHTNSQDEATWKMIAGLVGTHDNVEVAGLLGVVCGGWASIFGHTHEPLAKRKKITTPHAAKTVSQIVGNSGNINRKRPTCAVARFPNVTIYRYDPKLRELVRHRESGLSTADVQSFITRRRASRRASA